MIWRVVTPPPFPFRVAVFFLWHEHIAAHDKRTGVDQIIEHLGFVFRLIDIVKHPAMQNILINIAKWAIESLIWTSYKPVNRHCYSGSDLTHALLLKKLPLSIPGRFTLYD